LTSYCSTWTTPCRRVCFRSPPSRMKATSRLTIYPNIDVVQRWKREKSAYDQNCLHVYFCQTDWVHSHPFGQLVEECEKNNIYNIQHDPTVDAKDMATRALLAPLNSTLMSLAKFSLLSLIFLFLFLFLFFFGLVTSLLF
jgi:hypothetical protein